MKRIWLVMLVFLMISLTGCFAYLDEKNNLEQGENYMLRYYDENKNSVSIGDVIIEPEDGVLFLPHYIKGMPVVKLGFPVYSESGNLDGLNRLKRVYFPSTIKEIKDGYIISSWIHDVFYCGAIIDLKSLYSSADYHKDQTIYLPFDDYMKYLGVYTPRQEEIEITLRRANVAYYLNYDEYKYYYIDYYENGELIAHIPPIPEREGYEFNGWYKEKECINEWDFKIDTIIYDQGNPSETKLYAKWIQK